MKFVACTLLAVALVISTGCAGTLSVKQTIDRADRTAYTALRSFQVAEEAAWHSKQAWPTAAQHQQIGAKLSLAYTGVVDLATLGLDLQPGQPLPPQAAKLIADTTQAVVDLTGIVSAGAAQTLQQKIADAKAKVAALVDQVKGAVQ